MESDTRIVAAATMPNCGCVAAYHTNPIALPTNALEYMLDSWVQEGFYPMVMHRHDVSPRLDCMHTENWPRHTCAVPIDAHKQAIQVRDTLSSMRALAGIKPVKDLDAGSGGYYKFTPQYRNPFFNERWLMHAPLSYM